MKLNILETARWFKVVENATSCTIAKFIKREDAELFVAMKNELIKRDLNDPSKWSMSQVNDPTNFDLPPDFQVKDADVKPEDKPATFLVENGREFMSSEVKPDIILEKEKILTEHVEKLSIETLDWLEK